MSKNNIPKKYQDILDNIIEQVKAKYDLEQIILFGSLARGEEEEAGDIDIIVITQTNEAFRDRAQFAASVSHDLDEDVDMFIYSPEEYKMMEEEHHPFIESVKRNHKIIYKK